MLGSTTSDIPLAWPWDPILRLLLAMALGAIIGFEREHRGRFAGFRTQLLAALGAALAMVVSLHFGEVYSGAGQRTGIQVDPGRVAYGVMVGIGFLGAGTILHQGGAIRGLTTAAGMWCTAAVGLACGFGMYAVAIAATLMVLFALSVLHKIDRMLPARVTRSVTVSLPQTEEDSLTRVEELLTARGARIVDIQCRHDFTTKTQVLTYEITIPAAMRACDLAGIAGQIPGILSIHIT